MEVELFAERRWDNGGVGMALIRDGNGTRSFETLLRYRDAAIAEFWRALRTLKALQAEPAVSELPVAVPALVDARPSRSAARPTEVPRPGPNEPERRPDVGPVRGLEYVLPEPPASGGTLHEPAATWMPNEPEIDRAPHARSASSSLTNLRAPSDLCQPRPIGWFGEPGQPAVRTRPQLHRCPAPFPGRTWLHPRDTRRSNPSPVRRAAPPPDRALAGVPAISQIVG